MNMKHTSLASRYRPQQFASVIGQQIAVRALSRASAEDRIAPAYLLSGTRGTGKTTIARIFAKAMNCEHAPVAEPCNECSQCRQITAGNHVDVCEIDGASNTGVDDVRALRDNTGYMPMQGRYRVFIIDEAHMLSKNAFNALLKTLEEPPGHTVFIFATTEVNRFPATIVSRCQHFVFRHLPEEDIAAHLMNILQKENQPFEEGAVRLVARRAAGSVRDSLSLLDQTLALTSGQLDINTVRSSLGLAGQEFFSSLFEAIPQNDCEKIISLCNELFHSGADIGFFLREFASYWRNLFLFRQSGEKILPWLGVSPDEKAFLEKFSSRFGEAHLHAAWQMTLENQRSICQNPEPGPALELLLLNLAFLPRILPAERLSTVTDANIPRPAAFNESETDGSEKKNSADSSVRKINEHLPDAVQVSQESLDNKWTEFCEFCKKSVSNDSHMLAADFLGALQVEWQSSGLKIMAQDAMAIQALNNKKQELEGALKNFCGGNMPRIIYGTKSESPVNGDLYKKCLDMPEIKLCEEILGASLLSCRPAD